MSSSISWGTVRSLVIFFGPILLPKAISYYRSVRSASRTQSKPIQHVSNSVGGALFVLAFLTITYLFKSIPYFAPENIFSVTQSRLQIPVDVLFHRLAALRPDNVLTLRDEALRAKFVNMESKLLYFAVGPETLADCPFCTSDDSMYYFLYALPWILQIHLVNAIAIATVTSPSITGVSGSQWRTLATIVSAVLAGLDTYLFFTVDYKSNSRAVRLPDIEFFYWNLRVLRLVSLALLDGALAWVIFLSSTNRAFVVPDSPVQRISDVGRNLSSVKSKLNAMGIIKNTALRDEELRNKSVAYWKHEVRLMGEVMEEREVIEGVNDALENRINIGSITQDANQYAESVLSGLRGMENKRDQ